MDMHKYIYYSYDAAGNKLQKKREEQEGIMDQYGSYLYLKETIDYIGPFVYRDDVLQYIAMPEGRVVYTDSTSSYYEYHIKDNQGNTRVTLKGNGDVISRNDYYPGACPDYSIGSMLQGGTDQQPSENSLDNENNYLYSSKELQQDYDLDWFDFGARRYSLSRFLSGMPNLAVGTAPTHWHNTTALMFTVVMTLLI